MKYTINDFRKDYPNEAACLHKVWFTRYGSLDVCPCCNEQTEFRRISTRKAYQCRKCYHQIYPLRGTPFESTKTSLVHWFYAMFLVTCSRNGVAAKEIERQLNVSYPTALRMLRHIRIMMSDKNFGLEGRVEIDEMYFNKHEYDATKKEALSRSKGVLGMVERMGNVKAFTLNTVGASAVLPMISEYVRTGSIIYTDESAIYKNLGVKGYTHRTIKHSGHQYRISDISTNTIEGFWSQLRRMIRGCHIHVSLHYLQHYVDEAVWKYNNRKQPQMMFEKLFDCMR